MNYTSFFAALPLALSLVPLHGFAAEAQSDMASALAGDSLELVDRTYMGRTVQVLENPNQARTEKSSWAKQVRATGAIQTEFHVPVYQESFPTDHYDQKVLNNTYFDLTVNAPYVSAGARFQWTKYPLPGYAPEFAGWGVPYFWVTGKYKAVSVTAGDFYEQFGSGLILRTYQERALGVDGAIRGARVKVNPVRGLYLTALAGKERYFWHHNPDWLWGADAEWSLDETFQRAFTDNYGLTLGFSYVGKHDKQTKEVTNIQNTLAINFPKNVGAFDGRVKLRAHDFNVLAEFAYKNNDPCEPNYYIFKPGHAELLSVSYAAKGFSAFLQAKRSENMYYLSGQNFKPNYGNGFINHLPAFTNTQTYTLAAIYPYATDYNGEWAFQGQVSYLFKRGTRLGGRYGTTLRLSASYVSNLYNDAPVGSDPIKDSPFGTSGVGSPFWKIGSLRYADLNFEINKKFNSKLQFTLFYLFQRFNNNIYGHPDEMITANTFVLEGQWKMAKRTQLRWELQYLTTKQDEGDWMAGLVELSLAPHWMLTFTDTYNVGKTKTNYYTGMVTYVYKANRFSLSYGRTREGMNCTGGVCRTVPRTNGLSLTYNYTF